MIYPRLTENFQISDSFFFAKNVLVNLIPARVSLDSTTFFEVEKDSDRLKKDK